ncbi:MAG: TolC family protein [Planctomycetota bacterium]
MKRITFLRNGAATILLSVCAAFAPGILSAQDFGSFKPLEESRESTFSNQQFEAPPVPTIADSLDQPAELFDTIASENPDARDDSAYGQSTSEMGWWSNMVSNQMRHDSAPMQISLEEVLVRTLHHSNQIKVFSELPQIRRTAIVEADSAFDWTRYLQTRWDDLNDPVGSSLTLGPGGGDRYDNEHWTGSAGVRRRNRAGGELDLSQQIGHQETNSNFFVPNPQGTARLVLGYTQPLMRGRGRVYNESLIGLARLDKEIADDEFHRQLQAHLLEVTRAYWSLYLERGALFQKMNSFQRADEVYQILERRGIIDAQTSQIVSAKASASTRYAELIRARAAVKNAESRLRSLVNDPQFGLFAEVELIPVDVPTSFSYEASMQEAMMLAVQNRPEILQALKQIKAGSVRMSMSRHELLPMLNLVTQTYVAGLEGDGDVGEAWSSQFSEGAPGYSIGLNYELPVGNRASSARHTRRRLEMRQLKNQYATTLATVQLEVEVAVREVQTSSREMFAKAEAMNARAAQLEALTRRWQELPGEDVTASLALENLLEAQERLANAEFEFLQSQLTYNLALMNLKRASGMLLQTENIQIGEMCESDLPTSVILKDEFNGQTAPASGSLPVNDGAGWSSQMPLQHQN